MGHESIVDIGLEYDWIPDQCSLCKTFGHSVEQCQKNKDAQPTQPVIAQKNKQKQPWTPKKYFQHEQGQSSTNTDDVSHGSHVETLIDECEEAHDTNGEEVHETQLGASNGQVETIFPPEYTSSDPIPEHTNPFGSLDIILFSSLDESGNEKPADQAVLDCSPLCCVPVPPNVEGDTEVNDEDFYVQRNDYDLAVQEELISASDEDDQGLSDIKANSDSSVQMEREIQSIETISASQQRDIDEVLLVQSRLAGAMKEDQREFTPVLSTKKVKQAKRASAWKQTHVSPPNTRSKLQPN